MKYLVIANPGSGRGSGARQIPLIEEMLRRHALDFDLLRTEGPGHAITLAAQTATEGYDAVISVGGDGTINEIVNGLMQARANGAPQLPLAFLSVGTGNDLAFGLGVPTEIEAACRGIAKNHRTKIDLGFAKTDDIPDGRYFCNCIGIGFDAAGGILAEKITWTSGFLAYLIAALQNIFLYYKAPTLKIKLDDEMIEMPSLLVSIMNGQRIGGGFLIAPNALLDDGIFDLCIAEEVSRPRMLTLLPRFVSGTHTTQPEIQMKRARKIAITALKGTMPIQTDGEIICRASGEISIEILPKYLEIIGAAI